MLGTLTKMKYFEIPPMAQVYNLTNFPDVFLLVVTSSFASLTCSFLWLCCPLLATWCNLRTIVCSV